MTYLARGVEVVEDGLVDFHEDDFVFDASRELNLRLDVFVSQLVSRLDDHDGLFLNLRRRGRRLQEADALGRRLLHEEEVEGGLAEGTQRLSKQPQKLGEARGRLAAAQTVTAK